MVLPGAVNAKGKTEDTELMLSRGGGFLKATYTATPE